MRNILNIQAILLNAKRKMNLYKNSQLRSHRFYEKMSTLQKQMADEELALYFDYLKSCNNVLGYEAQFEQFKEAKKVVSVNSYLIIYKMF